MTIEIPCAATPRFIEIKSDDELVIYLRNPNNPTRRQQGRLLI
jgi:hypothetical protein